MGKFLSKGKRSYIILRQLNYIYIKKKKKEQSWSPTSIKNFFEISFKVKEKWENIAAPQI